MDATWGCKPTITPPVLISSQETVVVSTPADADPVIQDDWTPLRKRREEDYLKDGEKRGKEEAEKQAKEEQRYEEAKRREGEFRAREER